MKTAMIGLIGLLLIGSVAQAQTRTTVISQPGSYPTTVREYKAPGYSGTVVSRPGEYPVFIRSYGKGTGYNSPVVVVPAPQTKSPAQAFGDSFNKAFSDALLGNN